MNKGFSRIAAVARRGQAAWRGSLLLALLLLAGAAQAVSNPTVVGPIPTTAPAGDPSRNYIFLATTLFPAGSGYVEQEFFLDGLATSYTGVCASAGCTGAVAEAARTPTVASTGNPYRIRLVVRRPSDPAKFNGKVIVEWQNVTNNWELDVQWYRAADYFIRNGYAWVGVGPQRAGIHGTPNGLRAWNPNRYSTLDVTVGGTITDDSLKFDIFSQAGQAIKSPTGVDPLGGLPQPRTLIATGDSQSSANLAVYVNTVHQLDPIYPGFVLGGPLGIPIRDDANAKVLKVASEFDVVNREAMTRQPDSNTVVTWEVAGASHSDFHNFVVNTNVRFRDVGITGILPDTTNCVDPARSRAHLYLVYHAAYEAMAKWIATGVRPPSSAERLIVNYASTPVTINRDALGLAFGGVRLPDVVAPAALNTGTNSGGKGATTAGACAQAGTYIPFSDATLRTLYSSHADYVAKVRAAALVNVEQGFLLPADVGVLVADAQASDVLRTNGADGSIKVAEYYRTLSNQYFLASDMAERAVLETGGANGDWFAIGVNFTAWQAQGTFPADTVPVCRFFGAATGPTEHVFTADAQECATLQSNPRWIFEGVAFRVRPVTAGACPTGHDQVIRWYQPGTTITASRHFYTLASDTKTVTTGWTREGAIFCVLPIQ